MTSGYRDRLRKIAEQLPAWDGRLLTELLDETEPESHWRVSLDGMTAHLVNDHMVPVCDYRSPGPWRVVSNSPACEDCKAILESGVLG